MLSVTAAIAVPVAPTRPTILQSAKGTRLSYWLGHGLATDEDQLPLADDDSTLPHVLFSAPLLKIPVKIR
jgi:hypothetical protein